MKRVLSILATTAMAFSFMGSNLAHSCGCGCKCDGQNAPKQQCSCGCHKPPQGGRPACPMPKEEFAKILAEKQAGLSADLGLSKPQQDNMKVIFDAKAKALEPVITEIMAKKQALREIEQSRFELTKIKAKKQQKAALEGELSALKDKRKAISDKYHQDFEAILTDAQKVKWTEIKQQHQSKLRAHKHGHRMHRPSCGCGQK